MLSKNSLPPELPDCHIEASVVICGTYISKAMRSSAGPVSTEGEDLQAYIRTIEERNATIVYDYSEIGKFIVGCNVDCDNCIDVVRISNPTGKFIEYALPFNCPERVKMPGKEASE